jgi:6-phosphogluconate dehydrogenase (decarboxylating)
MKVAFIGVGNMGKPMAANIAEAGHELSVFDANVGLAAPQSSPRGCPAILHSFNSLTNVGSRLATRWAPTRITRGLS